MKISDLNLINYNKILKITDFDNFFNIYQDKNGNYFYNLNSTLYININKEILEEYICDYDIQWPLISYKIYGTTRLAWLLLKINNVHIKDIFKCKFVGDKILYLKKEYLNSIIEEINN